MDPAKSSSVVAAILLLLLLLASSVSAFNITLIFQEHPDFSQFNDLLTKSGVAAEINSRNTVTVLAVSNDAVSGISSKPADVQKRILSTHVLLDFYDEMKLNKLKDNKTNSITTLFQTTGIAQGRQGFITVGYNTEAGIVFGSSASGSAQDAKFMGVVMSDPYNISVVRISQPIIANGIESNNATAGGKTPAPEAAAAPPPKGAAADAPASDAPAAADAPADGPDAAVDGPSGDDSPSEDGVTEDAPPKDDSSAGRAVEGVVCFAAVALAWLGMAAL